MKLFIYGTLKRGNCRHCALADQQLLGEVRTQPRYRLYDAGAYPALALDSDDGRAIEGELWEVDDQCLARLDEIEGLGENLFRRERIRLEASQHQHVEAYFYARSIEGFADCGTRWEVE